MSYGHFNASTDTWTFTCAGCGKDFLATDSIAPLDGLDCCSAECDQIVESRPAPICRACECEIDEDGTCGCNPHDA